MTSAPTDMMPAVGGLGEHGTAGAGIPPQDHRAARRWPAAQAPSAAAWRATSSGVRSVPTMPRIPETLIISVSDMRQKIAETGLRRRCGRRRDRRRRRGREGLHRRRDRSGAGAAPSSSQAVGGRARAAGTRGWWSWRRRRRPRPRSPASSGNGVAARARRESRGRRSARGASGRSAAPPAILGRNGARIRSPRTVCTLDALEFLRGQRARLVQHRLAGADLADVVQLAAEPDVLQPVAGVAELHRRLHRVLGSTRGEWPRV